MYLDLGLPNDLLNVVPTTQATQVEVTKWYSIKNLLRSKKNIQTKRDFPESHVL